MSKDTFFPSLGLTVSNVVEVLGSNGHQAFFKTYGKTDPVNTNAANAAVFTITIPDYNQLAKRFVVIIDIFFNTTNTGFAYAQYHLYHTSSGSVITLHTDTKEIVTSDPDKIQTPILNTTNYISSGQVLIARTDTITAGTNYAFAKITLIPNGPTTTLNTNISIS